MSTSPPPYTPSPIDTSNVVLSGDLLALTERIAKSTHDNWALSRLRQGWQRGDVRDDRLKTHPCLIEYDSLAESEKDLDRVTALEAIKSILALGYRIIPPTSSTP